MVFTKNQFAIAVDNIGVGYTKYPHNIFKTHFCCFSLEDSFQILTLRVVMQRKQSYNGFFYVVHVFEHCLYKVFYYNLKTRGLN